MYDITEDTEQLYLDYMKENEKFLKEFHRVYYTDYKGRLSECGLSDYMITSCIRVNKIDSYSNYDEFVDGYLLQVSEDKEEAINIYSDYYWRFVDDMDVEINELKGKYNKGDDDIFVAYEIKTVFQFYTGFLMEKILMYHIENYSDYKVFNEGVERKRNVDDKYAIDIEIANDEGWMMAIQCKSYTYLNIMEKEKMVHINKHKKYRAKYNGVGTYYMLYRDCKPCYYVKNGKKYYWIESEKVLDLKSDDLYKGTFEEMIEEVKGERKCEVG